MLVFRKLKKKMVTKRSTKLTYAQLHQQFEQWNQILQKDYICNIFRFSHCL